MIPIARPAASSCSSANGIFTLTLNAAFALGFTLLGPLIVKIAGAAGADRRRGRAVLRRRGLLLDPAAGAAATRERRRDRSRAGAASARRRTPIGSDVRSSSARGSRYIRDHREIRWSLIYLGDRRVAGRRARRPRPELRQEDARARARGLRRRRPAARRRDRDGHPPAQRLRPLHPAAAGDRGRPDRARHPPARDGAVGPDQRASSGRRSPGRACPTCRS